MRSAVTEPSRPRRRQRLCFVGPKKVRRCEVYAGPGESRRDDARDVLGRHHREVPVTRRCRRRPDLTVQRDVDLRAGPAQRRDPRHHIRLREHDALEEPPPRKEHVDLVGDAEQLAGQRLDRGAQVHDIGATALRRLAQRLARHLAHGLVERVDTDDEPLRTHRRQRVCIPAVARSRIDDRASRSGAQRGQFGVLHLEGPPFADDTRQRHCSSATASTRAYASLTTHAGQVAECAGDCSRRDTLCEQGPYRTDRAARRRPYRRLSRLPRAVRRPA